MSGDDVVDALVGAWDHVSHMKKPTTPPTRATRAQLVTTLLNACEKHRENVKIKRVIEDPNLNSRDLKNDDFAKMMKLRRQK